MLTRRDIPWAWLLCSTALVVTGLAFVTSATWDPEAPLGMGALARQQAVWFGVALLVAAMAAQLPASGWRSLAVPAFAACVLIEVFMLAVAGTSLAPRIKGQANWLVLGPIRVQPAELVKLGTLLALARLVTLPGFDLRRPRYLFGALGVALAPAGLIAVGGDLGSALTFPAMALGVLVAGGAQLRHLALLGLIGALVIAAAVWSLPRESYQWRRLQAWLHPEQYQLAEGFQTHRGLRATGSGQVTGKGFTMGDQNRLGQVPEKHTDMIATVVGEETGFVGTSLLVLLFTAWGLLALRLARRARDACGRLIVTGFACQVMGQAGINLAVAFGLMPVTGVTLPFISYGGSSLLVCWLGIGMCIGAAAAHGAGRTAHSSRSLSVR